MARTCCPQYTIRLDSAGFKPDKKHRQVMNRFNRYLATGEKPGEGKDGDATTGKNKGKAKGKGKSKPESWIDTLRDGQAGYAGGGAGYKHNFEVNCIIHVIGVG